MTFQSKVHLERSLTCFSHYFFLIVLSSLRIRVFMLFQVKWLFLPIQVREYVCSSQFKLKACSCQFKCLRMRVSLPTPSFARSSNLNSVPGPERIVKRFRCFRELLVLVNSSLGIRVFLPTQVKNLFLPIEVKSLFLPIRVKSLFLPIIRVCEYVCFRTFLRSEYCKALLTEIYRQEEMFGRLIGSHMIWPEFVRWAPPDLYLFKLQ